MKFIGRIFLGVIALVAAFSVSGVALIQSIEPKDVQKFIVTGIKDVTGRQIKIAGKISVEPSLFPTITARNVSLANAEWGTDTPMVHVKRLTARLAIMPIMHGEFRIASIDLHEPKIRIEINKDGRPNWAIDFQKLDSKNLSFAKDFVAENKLVAVLKRVQIRKGTVHYHDQRSGRRVNFKVSRASLSGKNLAGPINIDVSAKYQKTPFTASGKLSSLYQLANSGRPLKFKLQGRTFNSYWSATGFINRPSELDQIEAKISMNGANAKLAYDGLGRLWPTQPDISIPVDTKFTVDTHVSVNNGNISAKDLNISASRDGIYQISGKGSVVENNGRTNIKMSVVANGSDLRPFSDIAGTQLPKGLPYQAAATLYFGSGGSLTAEDVQIQLPSSFLSGKFHVEPEKAWRIGIDVTSDRLKVSEVLAMLPQNPHSSHAAPSPMNVNEGVERLLPNIPLQFSPPKNMILSLKFSSKAVDIAGLTLTDVFLDGETADKTATVNNFRFGFADGQISGGLNWDRRLPQPILKTKFLVEHLAVDKLLTTFHLPGLLQGAAEAKIELSSTGHTLHDWLSSVSGSTEVIMDKGHISNRLIENFSKDLFGRADPDRDLPMNCLVSQFDLNSGKATSKNFILDTRSIAIIGTGEVDLKSETLDLKLVPYPKERTLLTISPPIIVTGSLSKPKAEATKGSVLTSVAGVAFSLVNPAGLLLSIANLRSGKNHCVSVLESNKTQEIIAPSP